MYAVSLLLLLQGADFWVMHRHPDWVLATHRPFSVSATLLAMAIIAFLWRTNRWRIPLSVMGAGFLANLLSYAEYGRFVDWIPMHFWYSSTPDIVVTFGCAGLLLKVLTEAFRGV